SARRPAGEIHGRRLEQDRGPEQPRRICRSAGGVMTEGNERKESFPGKTRGMTERWLLYGANGYTGELIAREAVARGMRPVLGGRSRAKVERLAAELGCESAVFSLDDHTSLVRALDGMTVALHCAGPFSATA